MVGVCYATSRFAAALMIAAGLLSGCSGSHASIAAPLSASSDPPPAVSAIDHTVTVTWSLADSFDVLPDGKCAGRGNNRGMSDGVRIQLHGTTTGFADETRATARFERQMLTGKSALSDDGLYCVLRAVFAPSMPDPDGYSVTFPGTPVHWDDLGKPGGTRFGRPDNPPGYGSYTLGTQTCRNLLDPPDKDCPEWAN